MTLASKPRNQRSTLSSTVNAEFTFQSRVQRSTFRITVHSVQRSQEEPNRSRMGDHELQKGKRVGGGRGGGQGGRERERRGRGRGEDGVAEYQNKTKNYRQTRHTLLLYPEQNDVISRRHGKPWLQTAKATTTLAAAVTAETAVGGGGERAKQKMSNKNERKWNWSPSFRAPPQKIPAPFLQLSHIHHEETKRK